jgi:hypothetical protein
MRLAPDANKILKIKGKLKEVPDLGMIVARQSRSAA